MGPQLPGLSSRGPPSNAHCRIPAAPVHTLHGRVVAEACASVCGQLNTSRCVAAVQHGSSSSRVSHNGWPLPATAGNHHSSSSITQAQYSSSSSRQSSLTSSSCPAAAAAARGIDQQHAAQDSQINSSNSSKPSRSNGTSTACSSQQAAAHDHHEQLSGAVIMKQLKATRSWRELQQVVQQHSQQLNWKHSSALLTHLAQLTQNSDLRKQQQQQQGWSADCAQLPPSISSSTSDPGVQRLVASLVQLVDAHIEQYDPRGLANTIWALSRLQQVTPMLQQQQLPNRQWLGRFCSISQPLLQQFDLQQLSNTLWALVQLQHSIPHAWLQDWYAAMGARLHSISAAVEASRDPGSSASSYSRSAGHLHAMASALCSVVHLPVSTRPAAAWLDDLLKAAAVHLQASSSSSAGGQTSSQPYSRGSSSSDGLGQAVSNLLWSCAQLQHQPPLLLLAATTSWVQDVAAAGQPCTTQLSNQSLANSMWALAKLQQQQHEGGNSEQERRESGSLCSTSSNCSSSSSRRSRRGSSTRSQSSREAEGRSPSSDNSSSNMQSRQQLVTSSGATLLHISSGRLKQLNGRHLSNVVWAAGALQLQATNSWLTQVQHKLAANAAGLNDQQVANILWGLSQLIQLQQQQQQQHGRQQQLLQVTAIEHLLEAQQRQLPTYSSQALSSSLLSIARLGVELPEALLQAWLKEIARRSYLSAAGGRAMADSCCALTLIRRNEAVAAATDSAGSSWRNSIGLGFQQPGLDTEWLTGFCSASASRLAICSGDELAGLGWAMASLRFRPPVPWLLAWHSALSGKAGSMSGAAAAKALKALHDLPAGPQGISKEAAAKQLVTAVTAASTGALDAQTLAVAASCIAAVYKGSRAASSSSSSSSSSNKSEREASGQLPSSSSSSSSADAQQALQRLLENALPSQVASYTSQQLVMVLSAAAAVKAALPQELLLASLTRLQQLADQRQLDSRGCASALAAVAKLAGASSSSRGHLHEAQQQQQQQRDEFVSNRQPVHLEVLEQQQRRQRQQQQQQQQQICVPRSWVLSMLKAFHMPSSGPAELSLLLWALAVLDFSPGTRWLAGWVKYSQQHLHSFSPSQLASCGWAFAVLNYTPNSTWRAAWLQGSGLQAAAAKPSEQALMLYAAAALGFLVERTWLQSFAMLAASGIRRWTVQDMSMGLWGLAQLGLRAVADGEVLEVLLGHMAAATAAGGMQCLSPHQQLQLLQAAVLLRQPTPSEEASAACLKSRLQQQQQQQQARLPGQLFSKSVVRRLRWRAKTAAETATAAAAAARAAVMQHQQLIQQQQLRARHQPSSGSCDSAALSAAVAAAAAAAQREICAYEACASDAAAAAAAVITATSGRSPDAVGLPLDQMWLLLWCKDTVPQLHRWTPSVAAAALSAVAALGGLTPPVAWQQQLLLQVLKQRRRLKQQEVDAISHALDALRSPLKQQWLSQVQVIYTPGVAGAAAAAAAASTGTEQQQQHRQMKRRRRLRMQRMPWLKGMGAAATGSTFAGGSGSQSQARGACYPQQLTGYQLRQQRRQHRAVRLATWWKWQQQQQRQRLLQQQWRSPADAARSVWRSPAATATGSFSSSSMQHASYISYSSSSASFGASPASSVDIGAVSVPALRGSPHSAAAGGSSAGPSLESRKLSSGLLAPRPVRQVPKQDTTTSSSSSSSEGASNPSSSGFDDMACNVSTDAAEAPGTVHAVDTAVASMRRNAAIMDNSNGISEAQPNGSRLDATAASGCNTGGNGSPAVGADAAVVQAVWSSFAAAGVPVVNSGVAIDTSSLGVGRSPKLNGMLQKHLSWACQAE